jgi:excisionase family DNA binding protein
MHASDLMLDGTVNVVAASQLSGLTTDKIRKMIETGELKAAKVGARWLIPRRELARVIKPQRTRKRQSQTSRA